VKPLSDKIKPQENDKKFALRDPDSVCACDIYNNKSNLDEFRGLINYQGIGYHVGAAGSLKAWYWILL
jgi:hypothetical protein